METTVIRVVEKRREKKKGIQMIPDRVPPIRTEIGGCVYLYIPLPIKYIV